eukprot:TRINITY_DN6012_c0_g1_i1.p1 TRINITY_DN6012_c0_g1~~TRINITY_DN6012_c0_g1_i1.p1  ORF type:complete len:406 (+),score=67.57 TRINITY_DN6012_c0_g1_i1:1-1218(+)
MGMANVACDASDSLASYRYDLMLALLALHEQPEQEQIAKATNRLCTGLAKLVQQHTDMLEAAPLQSFVIKLVELPVIHHSADSVATCLLAVMKTFPDVIRVDQAAIFLARHIKACSYKVVTAYLSRLMKASQAPSAIMTGLVKAVEAALAQSLSAVDDAAAAKLFGKAAQCCAMVASDTPTLSAVWSSEAPRLLCNALEHDLLRANASLALLEIVKAGALADLTMVTQALAPLWTVMLSQGLRGSGQDALDVCENTAQIMSEIVQRQTGAISLDAAVQAVEVLSCHQDKSVLLQSSPAVYDLATVLTAVLSQEETLRNVMNQRGRHTARVVQLLLTAGQAFEEKEQVTSVAVLQLIEKLIKPKATRSMLAKSPLLETLQAHRWARSMTQCGQQLDRLVQVLRLSA